MVIFLLLSATILSIVCVTFWHFNTIEKENTRRFEKLLDTYLEELKMGISDSSVAHLIPEEERQKIIDSLK